MVLEAEPSGQNPAARAAIEAAHRLGAASLLIVSSDLPLVSAGALREVVGAAAGTGPSVVAAAATGRGGTNALFMRPPGVVGTFFGDDSLARFEHDARARGVDFRVVELPELALDLDEPSDLELLAQRR